MRTLYPIRAPGRPGMGNACLRSGIPVEAALPSAGCTGYRAWQRQSEEGLRKRAPRQAPRG